MKHYKNAAGLVFAYATDGSQDAFIPKEQVLITHAEADAIRALPPPFVQSKPQELAAFREKREKMLNRLAGIGMAAMQAGNTELASAVAGFRQGLLDLPSHATVTAAADIVALKLALTTRYDALVAATPVAARVAFKGVDA